MQDVEYNIARLPDSKNRRFLTANLQPTHDIWVCLPDSSTAYNNKYRIVSPAFYPIENESQQGDVDHSASTESDFRGHTKSLKK